MHPTVINLAGPVYWYGYAMMVDKLVHHDVTYDCTTGRVIPVHGFVYMSCLLLMFLVRFLVAFVGRAFNT